MCGIAGIRSLTGSTADARLLETMLARIEHRGPDDQGTLIDSGLAIGMRRLSIVDLAGGHQPMSNEDGRVSAVFNGEIYNHLDIRRELEARGHRLTTKSDTEVLAHLWEDHGPDMVHHLRGMFGFAIWDARDRTLFLARDPLGVKPLYWTRAGGDFVFASEIKSLLAHPAAVRELDPEALSLFLTLKYVPAPRTLLQGVEAVPPGHRVLVRDGQITTQRYWDLEMRPRAYSTVDPRAEAERLEELLEESVRLRLMSDVPFGAFLSGGLDSSMVVGLMTKFLNRPVKTFSVGYRGVGEDLSELRFARMVADRYATDHHEVLVGAEDFEELMPKVVWHLDQPIADQASLAVYKMSIHASRHVKMVLTGEGGDELFAGYARHSGEQLAPLFERLPRSARRAGLRIWRRTKGLSRPRQALYALCQDDPVSRLVNWFALFNEDRRQRIESDWLKSHTPDRLAEGVFAEHLSRASEADPLGRMLYVDTKLWLADDLLARGDKMTMAASIEGRVPLLDRELVEFAATLPSELKAHGLQRKILLRRVAEKYLPEAVVKRPKKGFPTPLGEWFRGSARGFLYDHLTSDSARQRGFFDQSAVDAILSEHERGVGRWETALWSLLNVELWCRQFLDGDGADPSSRSSSSSARAVDSEAVLTRR